jgi:hypothetical protein
MLPAKVAKLLIAITMFRRAERRQTRPRAPSKNVGPIAGEVLAMGLKSCMQHHQADRPMQLIFDAVKY